MFNQTGHTGKSSMADFLTRCPKCGTSFRIGLAHLNSAKGTVRCGSCLNIFSAKQHLVKNQPSVVKPSATYNGGDSTYQNQDEPVFEKFDDDDLLISDDMDDIKNIEDTNMFGVIDVDTLNTEESNDHQAIPAKESNLFERVISDTEQEVGREHNGADESWALNLLKNLDDDDDDLIIKKVEQKESANWTKTDKKIEQTNGRAKPQAANAKKLNGATQPSASPAARKPAQKSKPAAAKPKAATAKKEAKQEHPDYQSVFEYNEKKPVENKKPANKKPAIAEKKKKPAQQKDDAAFALNGDGEAEIETRSEPKLDQNFENIDLEINEDAYPAAGRFYDSSISNTSFTDGIEPEPLDLSDDSDEGSWKTSLPLFAGVVFATLLLVAQILWLNLPQLSRLEPYRGYYASACEIIGCTLPTIVDRSKIRAANLVVRSHPTIADALIVDAVLQNSAPFPQSFPDLDLIFTDVKDKPIAARRFTPQEYLGGELAGSIEMPIANPVHIAVEIADPGSKAVSYRMSIAN